MKLFLSNKALFIFEKEVIKKLCSTLSFHVLSLFLKFSINTVSFCGSERVNRSFAGEEDLVRRNVDAFVGVC